MSWKFCPHCGHELPNPGIAAAAPYATETPPLRAREIGADTKTALPPYDQTKTWERLAARAKEFGNGVPETGDLVASLLAAIPSWLDKTTPSSAIVHVVMDRLVTPQGGALNLAIQSEGRLLHDVERLEALGYVIRDGKVETVEDAPIGRTYCALQYWGGSRQHRRWHLAKPIDVNPSRHGDPSFMDDCYFAFVAEWSDLERLGDAMTGLIDLLKTGFDGKPAGNPLIIDVNWSQ